MPFDPTDLRYLSGHHPGRLATVATDGRPQIKPVGYHYNPALGTIDIAGFTMDTSAKYRNIAVHPDVSFVVDDAIGEGPSGMLLSRCAAGPNRRPSLHRRTTGSALISFVSTPAAS